MNIGIVGACRRGGSFKRACDALPEVSIHAVCDINTDKLEAARERLGAREKYTDYETMLEKSELDAVIVATPIQLHATQAIAALERGLHVLSEVTAGVSVEECQQLVAACRKSKGVYMMAENYTYMLPNAMVREIVNRGLMGKTYNAEGEYIHEYKFNSEHRTPWRRKWLLGVDGVTYGTHSLGPILQWMPGDRVKRVCCEGAGVHHVDHKGEPYCQACATMLCKMESGGLVKIRFDAVSDRPHNLTHYSLQGTNGCYESARTPEEKDRIWLRERCPDEQTWLFLDDLKEEFMPDFWKNSMEQAMGTGHGGGDYFEVLDFVDAIQGRRPCPIGIDEAMDMTLPGLVSQQSILEGGRWIEVPDSRSW